VIYEEKLFYLIEIKYSTKLLPSSIGLLICVLLGLFSSPKIKTQDLIENSLNISHIKEDI